MKKKLESWKSILREINYIDLSGRKDERKIREAISELRKEGIIFIPINHVYWKIEKLNQETIEEYARAQVAHMQTQYFNTLRPLKGYIKDEKLKSMMGQLELSK